MALFKKRSHLRFLFWRLENGEKTINRWIKTNRQPEKKTTNFDVCKWWDWQQMKNNNAKFFQMACFWDVCVCKKEEITNETECKTIFGQRSHRTNGWNKTEMWKTCVRREPIEEWSAKKWKKFVFFDSEISNWNNRQTKTSLRMQTERKINRMTKGRDRIAKDKKWQKKF